VAPEDNVRVRAFDRKFGTDFLSRVPTSPGVYRFYDAADALLYIGKARDLRRRLAQYRTTRRTKRDRKRRALVKSAARIAWDVCATELDAELTELRLIQSLRPRENVAGAFSFLYPFIGIRVDGRETHFCLTTSPGAFPGFEFHGAFRSRAVTKEAFFALMRLLRFIGHAGVRTRRERSRMARHSHVVRFRRLPAGASAQWSRLLCGASREALEDLCLRLLEHPGARARSATIQEDLRAIERFFREEATRLAAMIAATGHSVYPVLQEDRDALLLLSRGRERS